LSKTNINVTKVQPC